MNAAHPVIDAVRRQRLVGIVRSEEPQAATDALRALADAGVAAVEVSLTTPSALAVLEQARGEVDSFVGVGTVLDGAAAERAVAAGAQFIVTPTVSAGVIATGNRYGVPVIAGAATPTEAVTAMELGATLVKLFPASAFGPRSVSDILAALPQVGLVPTGGVTHDSAPAFVEAGAVAVGMGSSLLRGDEPAEGIRLLLQRLEAAR